MQGHALTIFKVNKEWYGLTPEQREEKLDQIAKEQKAEDAANQWNEKKIEPCDWPQWFIDLVFQVNKRFRWDNLNREYKVAYRSEQEAEDAAAKFRATLEHYVSLPEHAEENKWYVAQKFISRVRPLTGEALGMDAEIADSLEEAQA